MESFDQWRGKKDPESLWLFLALFLLRRERVK